MTEPTNAPVQEARAFAGVRMLDLTRAGRALLQLPARHRLVAAVGDQPEFGPVRLADPASTPTRCSRTWATIQP
jgi:hypothetical protein